MPPKKNKTAEVVPADRVTPPTEAQPESTPEPEPVFKEIEWTDEMQSFTIYFGKRGELKEVEIEGKQVQLYTILGVNSRGDTVCVQLWRHNAVVFERFIIANQGEYSGQLYSFKNPKYFADNELAFRIKQPSDYQRKEFKVDYSLCLSVAEGEKMNFKNSKFTFDKLPTVVDWNESTNETSSLYQSYTKLGETTIEDLIHPALWHTKVLDSATSIPFKTLNSPQKKRSLFDVMSEAQNPSTPEKLQPKHLKL